MTDTHESDHPHGSQELALEDRLHLLASRVAPPAVPVREDLLRGRRRRRRTRLVVAGGAALAVGVVGVASTVVPDLVSAGPGPGITGTTASPTVAPSSTSPTGGPAVVEREVEPSDVPLFERPGLGGGGMAEITGDEALRRYRQVLVDHLDPTEEHLDAAVSNRQSGGSTSLGTKLGWSNDGESGLGMVQVSVNAGWDVVDHWQCGSGWDCRDVTAPGGRPGQVAVHDGVTDVAVEHTDGTVAIITVDALFGNNSTVPVSGIDLGEDVLAAAAADERLSLPGFEDGVPPALDLATFTAVGRELLAGPGERVQVIRRDDDYGPYVEAAWAGAGGSGTLTWTAVLHDPAGDALGCYSDTMVRCVVREVEGREVLVGYRRDRVGGGWQVTFDGPSYRLDVTFGPDTAADDVAVDRAVEMVLDPRWQPRR